MQYITMYLDSTNKFELTYQCYNLLVLSKHIVMYSIKLSQICQHSSRHEDTVYFFKITIHGYLMLYYSVQLSVKHRFYHKLLRKAGPGVT